MRAAKLLSLLAVPVLLAAAPAPKAKTPFKVTWLGHAAFEVVSPGGTDLLIDPFLTQDPATPAADKDLAKYKPAAILVTHSHGDHVGDTWIFGDMSLIQELYHPDVLLLCVGGGPYTEDPSAAALAVKKYFHPSVIVPMHYGTFPALAKEDEVRKAFAGDRRFRVMKPGETLTF